jgi:glycosyltransferase involved in cell wall biosynthesis
MLKNIGFVSTRFAGTDGVSLESRKWAEVFEKSGHNCFWFSGESDRNATRSLLVPEAHFKHKQNKLINEQVLGRKGRKSSVTESIHELRSFLKAKLYKFIETFNLDLLITENALTIPMHIPLGLALAEIIAEIQIATIAHHHDFFWERTRFAVNAVSDYFRLAFPPNLPNIEHVVINSAAREQLALRTGISSTIIPNVLDFANPPIKDTDHTKRFKQSIGLKQDDFMILQPTRIVKRKGIEHAIELVKELKDPRYKLVISHEAGDEGFEYAQWIEEYACEHNVDLRLLNTQISGPWSDHKNLEYTYSLWDIYPFADFITYPSLDEGFGNAFLEAIYFKKPILINRYATFVRDIEPQDFDLVVMDGFLTKQTVREVKEILALPERRRNMVDHNYEVAAQHYSYSVLRKHLSTILIHFFGDSVGQISEESISKKSKDFMKIASSHLKYRHIDGRSCQPRI